MPWSQEEVDEKLEKLCADTLILSKKIISEGARKTIIEQIGITLGYCKKCKKVCAARDEIRKAHPELVGRDSN